MARHDRNNKNKNKEKDMDREDNKMGDEGEYGGEIDPTRDTRRGFGGTPGEVNPNTGTVDGESEELDLDKDLEDLYEDE